MDAKQIRFFLEIARTGSFTSAAKKLFISVPGLVKSMDKLEDELGAPLFVRQRTGVCLSPAGRALEQMAPAYLRQTETIRAEVIKAACDRDAQAEVCMTWGLLSFFPANFLSRFVLSHPKINLCTRNDTIEGCYARVASGKSAIALVFGAVNDPALEVVLFTASQRRLRCFPKSIRLLENRSFAWRISRPIGWCCSTAHPMSSAVWNASARRRAARRRLCWMAAHGGRPSSW